MANRLAGETSPYLQQHADNPVDWHPWGEHALTLAREQDKPILLSIGYSACHWCHVMAQESFADPGVAEAMNAHFVNIKVDREERPDLDQIYQTAHAMLTGRSGGWPLTMFLGPDQQPFFGGTYFPKEPRYGLPGFRELLPRVAAFYRDKRDDIGRQNAALAEALAHTLPRAAPGPQRLAAAPLERALSELKAGFDAVHGGFGGAPKFPHPAELELCLRRYAATGAAEALQLAAHSLEKMAQGGIRDHLGGGFCRYSVDERWEIPHFEKMLYDNGPLLALYADAWTLTGAPHFKEAAEETAGWALREMQSPAGGFYSSLDADSEHEEGKYYVWDAAAARALLAAEEWRVAAHHYGLDGPPNFEHRHWHLRQAHPLEAVAARLGLPLPECQRLLQAAREKLFRARAERPRPGRDEKVLPGWNALMIRGLARAGRVFGRADWSGAARRAADFLRASLWRDGRLAATWRDGEARLSGYLDDHAFLLDALLELLQGEFRLQDLAFARELAEALLERFEDRAEGGFFFTAHDHEPLVHRPKPGHDNATPSGNGVAARALIRLGHLAGEPRYLEAAERTLRLFSPALEQQPAGHAALLMALEEALDPPAVVVLRGPAQGLAEWQKSLSRDYLPQALIVAIEEGAKGLPPALDKPAAGGVNAWVCRGVTCLPAIPDPQELRRICKTRNLA